ncbi:MAG: hypothetical protein E6H45_00310 [Betaproteobacteria bacterium]|nr:MAG: hypothetical protein E6H45_00310 [Betaproteobacteria bacterium]
MKEMRDAALRDRALDVRRSFTVQAPAGSGKTELLVRRFLKLLSTVKQPEEILAITFTKKAAAEMRKRVLERLPSSGEIAHRLRIQTIDAFCTALTRQVPVLARFGAQPEIIEDASELYFEAAGRVFKEFNPASEKLLAHLDNDIPKATRLLADRLKDRDRWLRKTGDAPTRAELEATLASERNRLLARAKALYPRATEALARGYLTTKGEWTKRPAAPKELVSIPGLREALFALCNMPPAEYDDRQWEALEAILALLKPAVAHLKVLFGERGQADFTEFAHGALAALGSVDDPSDLLLSLDQKISHVLVDEFQDTSLSQFELLTQLTSGWQQGDGRTLFLVGDPMQSIYRFREAEVSLFLRAKHSGLGSVKLEPIELSTNRRSQEGLVKWFNESFPRVLPAQEDQTSGAVPYLPASPHESALPGAAVTWHCGYDREEEAKKVVAIVREASGSKAILVRNRAHLDEIVPALKEAGVRFRALDIEQLGEKQVVQDLYALTRALLHLGDRIAWLACLRAPWCGLTLADLLALSSGRREEGGSEYTSGGALIFDKMRDVTHLSTDGQKRVDRVRSVLAPLVKNRLRGSLRERVEGAWLALGGPACVESETDLPRVRHRHRPRPRPPASLRPEAAPRLEVAPSLRPPPRTDRRNRRRRRPDIQVCPRARQGSRRHRIRPPLLRRRHPRQAAPAPPRLREGRRRLEAQGTRQALPSREDLVASARALRRSARRCDLRARAHADPRCTASPSGRLRLAEGATFGEVDGAGRGTAGRGDRVLMGRRNGASCRNDRAPLAAAHRRRRVAHVGGDAHRRAREPLCKGARAARRSAA